MSMICELILRNCTRMMSTVYITLFLISDWPYETRRGHVILLC